MELTDLKKQFEWDDYLFTRLMVEIWTKPVQRLLFILTFESSREKWSFSLTIVTLFLRVASLMENPHIHIFTACSLKDPVCVCCITALVVVARWETFTFRFPLGLGTWVFFWFSWFGYVFALNTFIIPCFRDEYLTRCKDGWRQWSFNLFAISFFRAVFNSLK